MKKTNTTNQMTQMQQMIDTYYRGINEIQPALDYLVSLKEFGGLDAQQEASYRSLVSELEILNDNMRQGTAYCGRMVAAQAIQHVKELKASVR